MFYKSKIFLMAILFMLAMVLVGCNITAPGEPNAKVTITSVSGYLWQTKGTLLIVSVDPENSGSVSGITTGLYISGTRINISAKPASGYEFDFWTTTHPGTISDLMAASTIFRVDVGHPDTITITAHFKEIIVPQPGATGETGQTGPQGPAGQDLTLPDSIYVYYTITNIGNVDIQEYTIYFDAETNKGVYTGIATGEDLAIGATVYSYVKIDVSGNEVTFIDYSFELK